MCELSTSDAGFVDNNDRVALNTLDLATTDSSGAKNECVMASIRSSAAQIVSPSYAVAAAASAAGSHPGLSGDEDLLIA